MQKFPENDILHKSMHEKTQKRARRGDQQKGFDHEQEKELNTTRSGRGIYF